MSALSTHSACLHFFYQLPTLFSTFPKVLDSVKSGSSCCSDHQSYREAGYPSAGLIEPRGCEWSFSLGFLFFFSSLLCSSPLWHLDFSPFVVLFSVSSYRCRYLHSSCLAFMALHCGFKTRVLPSQQLLKCTPLRNLPPPCIFLSLSQTRGTRSTTGWVTSCVVPSTTLSSSTSCRGLHLRPALRSQRSSFSRRDQSPDASCENVEESRSPFDD